jgi:hypothetical protein
VTAPAPASSRRSRVGPTRAAGESAGPRARGTATAPAASTASPDRAPTSYLRAPPARWGPSAPAPSAWTASAAPPPVQTNATHATSPLALVQAPASLSRRAATTRATSAQLSRSRPAVPTVCATASGGAPNTRWGPLAGPAFASGPIVGAYQNATRPTPAPWVAPRTARPSPATAPPAPVERPAPLRRTARTRPPAWAAFASNHRLRFRSRGHRRKGFADQPLESPRGLGFAAGGVLG